MKKQKVVGLIDADIIAYKASSAVETPIKWDDNLWTLHADEDQAYEIAVEKLESIKDKINAEQIYLCFSDRENFRKDILPTYKSNRKETRKPMCLQAVKDRLSQAYTSFVLPRLEADDVLGIMATSPKLPGEKVIVSADKDLKQIPCRVFNPDKNQWFEKEGEDSLNLHLMQTLTGDTSDGYIGCPTVGPVKAKEILQKAEGDLTQWDCVVAAFEKAGLTEEDALIQARVAYILRHGDYINNKIKLWKPSK